MLRNNNPLGQKTNFFMGQKNVTFSTSKNAFCWFWIYYVVELKNYNSLGQKTDFFFLEQEEWIFLFEKIYFLKFIFLRVWIIFKLIKSLMEMCEREREKFLHL